MIAFERDLKDVGVVEGGEDKQFYMYICASTPKKARHHKNGTMVSVSYGNQRLARRSQNKFIMCLIIVVSV